MAGKKRAKSSEDEDYTPKKRGKKTPAKKAAKAEEEVDPSQSLIGHFFAPCSQEEAYEAAQATSPIVIPSRTPKTDAALAEKDILAKILQALPMRDLLFSQRVCRKWRQTIEETDSLREALFFKATAPTEYWRIKSNSGDPELSQISKSQYQKLKNDPYATALCSAELNPMLKLWDETAEDSAQEKFLDDGQSTVKMDEWDRPAAKRKNASWRKMLLSQPPAKNIVTLATADGMTAQEDLEFMDINEGGVTLGEVMAQLQKAEGRGKRSILGEITFLMEKVKFPESEEEEEDD